MREIYFQSFAKNTSATSAINTHPFYDLKKVRSDTDEERERGGEIQRENTNESRQRPFEWARRSLALQFAILLDFPAKSNQKMLGCKQKRIAAVIASHSEECTIL